VSRRRNMELEAGRHLVPPTPVVLVSTLYGGVKNVAPFGMFMPVSSNPPIVALGIRDTRDTFKNIQDSGEFVIGIPGPELVAKIEVAGEAFPRDVSEFEKAGLTAVPSRVVKPYRIKECQAHLECRLVWAKEAGDHFIVAGEVVAASLRDDVHQTGRRADLEPVFHVDNRLYARRGALIEA
jgi:flavin reductase (DIM6/NTAB) family NADH-FMN oxidoreductase RutF